jgi:hypothetical protein
MRLTMTRCGGAGLIALALACATLHGPSTPKATSTSLGNCSIQADRVSVRTDGNAEIVEYAGQSVLTCPGRRPVVYSNLTVTRRQGGAFEMAADSVEQK